MSLRFLLKGFVFDKMMPIRLNRHFVKQWERGDQRKLCELSGAATACALRAQVPVAATCAGGKLKFSEKFINFLLFLCQQADLVYNVIQTTIGVL